MRCPPRGNLKWVIVLVAVTTVLAGPIGWLWYRCGQPDPILPDENFELQFGRGSGWHGLDLLRITADGNAVYEYQTNEGNWQRKRFIVDQKGLADLRKAINALNPWGMARAYHANVADGTQWVLLVRTDGKSTSVYFDNNFPDSITTFAAFVDQAIIGPYTDLLEPEIVPERHHRKHEKEIWESIR